MRYLISYIDIDKSISEESLINAGAIYFCEWDQSEPQVSFVKEITWFSEPTVVINTDKPFSVCRYDNKLYIMKTSTIPDDTLEVNVIRKTVRKIKLKIDNKELITA